MEAETDEFLRALQKRQRNLSKKLDRIHLKQTNVKAGVKDMKEEERKLLESFPLLQEQLCDVEKLIKTYEKHLAVKADMKKPQAKPEENKSKELMNFWLLGEFLSIPEVKSNFLKENPAEQDLEAFLLFHSKSKGQTGESLTEIVSVLEKSAELFLAKSDKIAPGTMRTYRKLSEFANRGQQWSLSQNRPSFPVFPKVPEFVQKKNFEVLDKTTEKAIWSGIKEEKKNEELKPLENEGFIEVTTRKAKSSQKNLETKGKNQGKRFRNAK